MIVIAPIAGRLFGKADSRLLIAIGIVTLMVGYFYMGRFTLEVDFWHMLPGLLLTGSGMALTFNIMSATCMRTIPPGLLTAAAGLYTLSRRVGGNLGYAFVATQLPHRASIHRSSLAEHVTLYDNGVQQVMDGLSGRLATTGLPPGVAEQSAWKLLDTNVSQQATMMAFNDIFWMMGSLFIICLPLLLLFGGHTQRSPLAH